MKTHSLTMAAAVTALLLSGPIAHGQQNHHHHGGTGASQKSAAPDKAGAQKAYMDAMEKMHAPMMEGMKDSDPDVAFVKGMIPHHQGAIDMAKIVLQYGKDPQTKKWARDVIREQEREIKEMQGWLKKRGS
jgi:uncharacterized protein (DUF305 family)